jgi:hypothetical protein
MLAKRVAWLGVLASGASVGACTILFDWGRLVSEPPATTESEASSDSAVVDSSAAEAGDDGAADAELPQDGGVDADADADADVDAGPPFACPSPAGSCRGDQTCCIQTGQGHCIGQADTCTGRRVRCDGHAFCAQVTGVSSAACCEESSLTQQCTTTSGCSYQEICRFTSSTLDCANLSYVSCNPSSDGYGACSY